VLFEQSLVTPGELVTFGDGLVPKELEVLLLVVLGAAFDRSLVVLGGPERHHA